MRTVPDGRPGGGPAAPNPSAARIDLPAQANLEVLRKLKGNQETLQQAVIDHICYTITNWDDAKVVGAFKEVGLDAKGREGSRSFNDPFNYHVQIASAVGENAFKRG